MTCKLMVWLPGDAQARMAADVVDWLCADLAPAERQEILEPLTARLLARLRNGQFGLQLVAYYHLLRLSPWRWLKGGQYYESNCS
jgi:hypothetical protein